MKKIFTLISLVTLTGLSSQAQVECNGTRYRTYNLFPNLEETANITYGANTAVSGGNQILKFDIYEPSGDTETNRPVIVMCFGGSFIGGAKEDVADISRVFAKMGYVVIAPSYRVGFFFPINQVSTTLAVVRAAHDIKAVVRFLRKSVAEEGNPYGIDAERVIIGGISAGGIGAVHAAYLDDINEFPAYMANDSAGLGGIEGNTGNLGYSSRPLGVLSFSGAIGDSSWIDANSVPICSIHEELDPTVPYNTTEVSVSGFPTGLIASGSRDLHARAAHLGVDNCLLTYPGVADHVGYFSGGFDQIALDFATRFAADMVCDGGSFCGSNFVGIDNPTVERNMVNVYPNPTTNELRFTADAQGLAQVYDMTGRMVLSHSINAGVQQLNVASLPKGSYVLQVIGESIATAHFVKQ